MDENRDKKIASLTKKQKEKELEEIEEELGLVEKVINDPETNLKQVFTNEVNFRTLLQVLYDKNIITEEEVLEKYNQVVKDVVQERLQQFGISIDDDEEQ